MATAAVNRIPRILLQLSRPQLLQPRISQSPPIFRRGAHNTPHPLLDRPCIVLQETGVRRQALDQRSLTSNSPRIQRSQRAYRPRRPVYRRFGDEFNKPGSALGLPYVGRVQYFWRSYRMYIIGAGSGGVVFYIYHQEDVPVTGRKRFNCVSEAQEALLGAQGYREIMSQYHGRILPDTHPLVQGIKGVLTNLITAAGTYDSRVAEFKWELHVVADPQKNAFVLPGGKVFVYTGILPLCKDEQGLAAVLGHEIAHALLHHHAERLSSEFIALPIVVAASIIFGVSAQLPSLVLDLVYKLPHSRTHESEADRVGLMIMARSCYNPESASKFWNRMRALKDAAPPEILSTHPSNETRITGLRQWMPEAQAIYDDSGCAEFLSFNRASRRAF